MTSRKRSKENLTTIQSKKRRITKYTCNKGYIELYNGKMVDFLLKLSQSNHPNTPDWLSDPKNKRRIQLQLKFLSKAVCYNDKTEADGKLLFRIGDIIFQQVLYQQSYDEDGEFRSK